MNPIPDTQYLKALALLALLAAFSWHIPCWAQKKQEKEDTYSIALVKTADPEKDVYKVDQDKVFAEEYTIQKGDYIWKLLRQKGLFQKYTQAKLISVLKQLNKSLENLDLVHPGEKIVIPLKIAPMEGIPVRKGGKMLSLTDLKDVDFENYTVKPGDSVIRVIKGKYDIPPQHLYDEFLALTRKLNPSVKDLNTVYPGQVIRLPIYSPQVVRKPIVDRAAREFQDKMKEEEGPEKPNPLAHDLATIFSEMGEEWIQTGKHFIPLKSGGQIDLKAASFPIIGLRSGLRVVVDLDNKFPEKVAALIASSWGNYRVVHLLETDDLGSGLGKVLAACDYPRLLGRGDPLELEGDLPLRLTGDWVVVMSENPATEGPAAAVITLRNPGTPATPGLIKDYLKKLDIAVIDHPSGDKGLSGDIGEARKLRGGGNASSLIKALLELTGQDYSEKVEIPVYQSKGQGFRLVVKADFLLKVDEKDAIIDLTGMGREIVSLLEEHRFLVLSLAQEKDPLAMISSTLSFLGVPFRAGNHPIMAAERETSRNIALIFSGVIFPDDRERSVLATTMLLPEPIEIFLGQKGYQILPLPSPTFP